MEAVMSELHRKDVVMNGKDMVPVACRRCAIMCEMKTCCKKYKRGKRCKKCPKK